MGARVGDGAGGRVCEPAGEVEREAPRGPTEDDRQVQGRQRAQILWYSPLSFFFFLLPHWLFFCLLVLSICLPSVCCWLLVDSIEEEFVHQAGMTQVGLCRLSQW